MASPFTLKWGILATGGIAKLFSRDLLVDPSTRSVADVAHKIVAVASSSSAARAREFVNDITEGKGDESVKTYGSYEELVADKNADIIYIATPHSHHYENALLCLNAGKHVCCEKPFTINAKQTKHLIRLAKSKNLFLMEAVWTRFFPISLSLQKLLHEDRILGKLHRVHADFGLEFPHRDPKHRLFNPELGGGALLDLGIYSITHVMMYLYHHPDNQLTAPEVIGTMLKAPETGVDEFTTVSLNFPKLHASGLATTNMTVRSHKHWIALIQGEKGDITVQWSPFRPESYTIHLQGQEPTFHKFDIPGHGMFWEADACARAIRDGQTEAAGCTLAESTLVMEIMDEVREQNGFGYPDALEALRE